jgi:hypothetical protein
VAEPTIAAPGLIAGPRYTETESRRGPRLPSGALPWVLGGAGILALAALFNVLSGIRPAYDAYGWVVWGRQALHLSLNTNSAPSWKPLTFLFTLPYAVTGRGALSLWMVTATAGAFAAPVFGARVAYRLTGPVEPRRRYAPFFAAAFGAAGVLGIAGYWHFTEISYADPFMVALSLAAVDCHLSGRRRAAWVLVVLVALGRPEGWPIAVLYLAWQWRVAPERRRELAVGAVLIPVLWLGVPALTAPSPFIASRIALESTVPLSGNRVVGILNGFFSLYELPMRIAWLVGLGIAILRRDRAWLVIGGAGVVWVVGDIALALHGWAPAPRYMFEPAAIMAVLVAATAGQILGVASVKAAVRLAGVAGLIALLIIMFPHARFRARLAHNGIVLGQRWARQLDRLHNIIAREGGTKYILSCGQAVTTIPYQSILAWEMGENIRDVGWVPQDEIATGKPIVYFQPVFAGWQIHPIHTTKPGCRRLEGQSEAFN